MRRVESPPKNLFLMIIKSEFGYKRIEFFLLKYQKQLVLFLHVEHIAHAIFGYYHIVY